MSTFSSRLAERQPDPAGRRWLYVPYDQLTDAVGPLAKEPSVARFQAVVTNDGRDDVLLTTGDGFDFREQAQSITSHLG